MKNEIYTQRLMELYKNSNSSIREISEATGIPKSALQRYFSGKTKNIPTIRLGRLASYFDVSLKYLSGVLFVVDHSLAGSEENENDRNEEYFESFQEENSKRFFELYGSLSDDNKSIIDQMMQALKDKQ